MKNKDIYNTKSTLSKENVSKIIKIEQMMNLIYLKNGFNMNIIKKKVKDNAFI